MRKEVQCQRCMGMLALLLGLFVPAAFGQENLSGQSFIDRLEQGSVKQELLEKRVQTLKSGEGKISSPQKVWHYPNGDEYIGDVKDRYPHGDGQLHKLGGDTYIGQFQYGMFDGYGEYHYHNGDIYRGQWLNGKRHGQGTLSYSNGNVYEGQWVEDKRQGKGILKFASGTLYEGEWLNDYRHGRGVLRFRNGDKYVGDFQFNKPHGEGVWVESDGFTYRGTFSKGKRHGIGECFQKKSDIQVCVYDRGQRITDPAIIARASARKPDKIVDRPFTGGLDYVLNNDFTNRPAYIRHEKAQWKKKVALLSTELRIIGSGGPGAIKFVIPNYKGPGDYALSQDFLTVRSPDGKGDLLLAGTKQVDLKITVDDGNKISGLFRIPELALEEEKETRYRIEKGRFEAYKGGPEE